ncbi:MULTISPECIES: hypothetical protein [unclassified Lysobacter]|uniref:hypothetical protein n=1 Tax=unclassified Lysobacter TaxID=2635362 RepID=UPI001BECE38E|nr:MULTISPECIES: hypothetical protein [unclassified Lysobacter]MBT2747727.1 hypothetical protein [Lysobacter sp. ISL-42]MBT2754045.1 hypothetical protein [Lysobacter sp. ISL-50]MBT2779676.1 hypothetical protein [Lysobacter sp. ISL-54]MBT2780145.1 hypothetical protein [Lysobacter sp. ISL-52]
MSKRNSTPSDGVAAASGGLIYSNFSKDAGLLRAASAPARRSTLRDFCDVVTPTMHSVITSCAFSL